MKFRELRIVAVDPSLLNTGYYLSWCDIHGAIDCSRTSHVGALLRIGQQLERHIGQADLVLYEDYTFSQNSRSLTTMGEINGLVTYLTLSAERKIVGVNVSTWRSKMPEIRECCKKTKSDREIYITVASELCGGKRFTSTDEADAVMIYNAVAKLFEDSPEHKLVRLITDLIE